MDITWGAIGKLLLAGIGTYVVFPAALILRDYLLWKFIHFFILNEKLRKQIRTYAIQINIWNTTYAVKTNFSHKDGKTTYTINSKEVTSSEWKTHHDGRDNLQKTMQESFLYINRQSNFLKWMLKHYKQDATNPIDEWFKKDIELTKERGNEESANKSSNLTGADNASSS